MTKLNRLAIRADDEQNGVFDGVQASLPMIVCLPVVIRRRSMKKEVEPAARRPTLPLARGRRDRHVALKVSREVGVDLTTTGDLNDFRRIPLHGILPLHTYHLQHEAEW